MTTRDDIEARKKDMQPWYWWGIPTFFKCPWNEDPEACDIALIGVPHSAGTDRPSVISTSARGRCLRIVKAHQRTPGVSGRDRDGGFPRRIDVVPPVLRCEGIAASGPRLAENHGKPSL